MRSSRNGLVPSRIGLIVDDTTAVAMPLVEADPPEDTDAIERLDGFRVGREEGYAAGYAEGLASAMASMTPFIDGLHDSVRRIEEASDVVEDRVAAMSVALAAELAEAIVGGDLSLLESGEDVIVRAFGLRRHGEAVRIRVHPDHPVLREPVERAGVELIADPEMTPTGALAEIGEGMADLSIDAALARVKEALV
ncbi:MAG: hypothetical protein AAGC53_02630 [Actinomycetota bacterium]